MFKLSRSLIYLGAASLKALYVTLNAEINRQTVEFLRNLPDFKVLDVSLVA